MRLGAAKTKIRLAHCRVGRVAKRVNARRAGRVLKQTPRAGAVRSQGTRVNLVVGRR
jgi:beta-lactam-binding protein with PASTA domain